MTVKRDIFVCTVDLWHHSYTLIVHRLEHLLLCVYKAFMYAHAHEQCTFFACRKCWFSLFRYQPCLLTHVLHVHHCKLILTAILILSLYMYMTQAHTCTVQLLGNSIKLIQTTLIQCMYFTCISLVYTPVILFNWHILVMWL